MTYVKLSMCIESVNGGSEYLRALLWRAHDVYVKLSMCIVCEWCE